VDSTNFLQLLLPRFPQPSPVKGLYLPLNSCFAKAARSLCRVSSHSENTFPFCSTKAPANRRDNPSLQRSRRRMDHLAIRVQHPCLEPLGVASREGNDLLVKSQESLQGGSGRNGPYEKVIRCYFRMSILEHGAIEFRCPPP
jgi:hypothetical protein